MQHRLIIFFTLFGVSTLTRKMWLMKEPDSVMEMFNVKLRTGDKKWF